MADPDVNLRTGAINTGKVTATKLAGGAVVAAKLGALAVETAKINNLAVTAEKIAADAVITAKILDLNVTDGKLAADAVTTAKILNANVTAAKLATDAVETAKIKNVNVTEAKIEVGAAAAGLSGLVAKFIAAGNVIGGVPVIHWIHITAGANGDTDITLTHKTKVVYAIFLPSTTVAASTYQLKNVADPISDAVLVPTAGTLGLPLTWDNTKTDIAAGTVLRVTGATGLTMPAGDVYVLGFRVA